MLALDIMLLVLAQSAVSAPALGTSPAPVPNVEVVGPTQQRRVICRTITPSGSHIAARRVCQTVAQIGEARDRMQDEADRDVRSTMRRTNEMLENSGYGNWVRSRRETPAGITDVRPVQTCRIRMGAAGC
jgi:hypothetical protein